MLHSFVSRFVFTLMLMWLLVAAAEQPNIIFILTDDLGYGDVGVYYQNFRRARGLPAFHTPNLDRMAAEGVRMVRHYTAAPVCAPARGSVLTGMHQGHANIRDNEFNKELENNHTLATVLRDAGYATAAVGKWGIGGAEADSFPAHPLHRGFDFYFGVIHHTEAHYHYPKEFNKSVYHNFERVTDQLDKAYSTDLYTARTKRWIQDHHNASPEQPFFLYLAYTAPHAKLEVPTRAYPEEGVQWTGVPDEIINTASGVIDSWIHPDYDNPDWPEHARRHATMVRRLDDAIGDLLDFLDTLGLGDNTLIVFTSDNGPHHEPGNGGTIRQDPRFFRTYGPLDGTKRDIWEGGIRVPTLVRWPAGFPAERVSTHPSQFHDWLPTFAELAGHPLPFRSDGVSLVNDLSGEAPPRPGTVYVEFTTNNWSLNTNDYEDFHPSRRNAVRGHMQVLYRDGFKGIRYNVQTPSDAFQVYETLADPQETENLAGQTGVPSQTEFSENVLRMRRVHPPIPGVTPARAYDTSPVPSLTLPGSRPGVQASVFEGDFPYVTTFEGLTPSAAAEVQGLDLSLRTRDHHLGFRFSGWLSVPVTGEYEFFLTTDTGAVMRLHDILLLDADFGYEPNTERSSGKILLEAGLHPYRLHTRHSGPEPFLSLAWSGPGFAKQALPAEVLLVEAPPAPPEAIDLNSSTLGGQPVLISVLPVPAPEGWEISGVDKPFQGSAIVQESHILYTPGEGFYGEDVFGYTLSNGTRSSDATVTVEVYYKDHNLLWLPFDEGEDRTVRDAGGRPVGSLEASPAWIPGPSGFALDFDGVQDHVRLNPDYVPPSGTEPRTVSAWIRAEGNGSIVAWGLREHSRKWHFRLDDGAGVAGRLRIEVEGGFRRGARTLTDGRWHHVAVVLPEGADNVDQVRLYVNGAEDVPYETTPQAINTAATLVEIGKDNHSTPRFFPGGIDEVRIVRRALSSSEIADLANRPDQRADRWHYRHFGPAPQDWQADDLGDGTTRLERLAMGWNPWSPLQPGRLRLQLGADGAELRYQRLIPGLFPVDCLIEWSPDLSSWYNLPSEFPHRESLESEREEVTIGLSPESLSSFFRLLIRLPD
ncbi:MAG: sulfatase-like hydrolase/transferase [Kiritimatiellae bacterium]|nr:sulfatase-like hydrolase/transferase [Kiritimatiellia bacterium]